MANLFNGPAFIDGMTISGNTSATETVLDGAYITSGPSLPTITNISENVGNIGDTVTFTGTNFISVSSVDFNGTAAASYIVVSSTSITAVVPSGITGNGPVHVVTTAGTAIGPDFTYFTPLSISNCVAWLRSDLGITLNSGYVATWADQSGHSANATGTSGNHAVYNTGGLNGRQKLTFDGASSYMTWSAVISGAQTIVFVFQATALPGSTIAGYYQVFQIPGASGGTTLNGFFELNLPTYPNVEFAPDITSAVAFPGPTATPDTNPHKWVVSYNGSGSSNYPNYQFILTGGSPLTYSGSSGAISPGVSSDGGVIGAVERSGAFSAYAPMDFYEIIVYNRVLNSGEISSLNSYLLGLYGI